MDTRCTAAAGEVDCLGGEFGDLRDLVLGGDGVATGSQVLGQPAGLP